MQFHHHQPLHWDQLQPIVVPVIVMEHLRKYIRKRGKKKEKKERVQLPQTIAV